VDVSLWLVALTVGTTVVFDFTNGFHDTANATATTIATRALPPRVAVGLAAVYIATRIAYFLTRRSREEESAQGFRWSQMIVAICVSFS